MRNTGKQNLPFILPYPFPSITAFIFPICNQISPGFTVLNSTLKCGYICLSAQDSHIQREKFSQIKTILLQRCTSAGPWVWLCNSNSKSSLLHPFRGFPLKKIPDATFLWAMQLYNGYFSGLYLMQPDCSDLYVTRKISNSLHLIMMPRINRLLQM